MNIQKIMRLKNKMFFVSYLFMGEFNDQLHAANAANNPDDLLKIIIADPIIFH